MTGPGKRLCAAVLLLCVLTGGVLPVKAYTQEYRQQLLKAYSSSPEGSSATIETCLEALEAESPAQGAMWRAQNPGAGAVTFGLLFVGNDHRFSSLSE